MKTIASRSIVRLVALLALAAPLAALLGSTHI
jgi:hypothetical protein